MYRYRYGTSRSLLERFSREGRDVILDLDGQGARQMRNKDLQGIFIFLLPPSWAELKRRLARRQTEGPKALKERLRMAKVEMAEARWYDYVIINDEIKKAEEQLQAIILSEHCRRVRMAEALEEMPQGKETNDGK